MSQKEIDSHHSLPIESSSYPTKRTHRAETIQDTVDFQFLFVAFAHVQL